MPWISRAAAFDQRLEIISMLMDSAFHRSSLMQRHQLSYSTICAGDLYGAETRQRDIDREDNRDATVKMIVSRKFARSLVEIVRFVFTIIKRFFNASKKRWRRCRGFGTTK